MHYCYPFLHFIHLKDKFQRLNLPRLVLLLSITLLASASLHAQTWTQLGIDIDGEADSDGSGSSVSISADGSTVAIGAIGNAGGGGYSRGHVRVYKNMSGTWIQQGADIDGEADEDYLGSSVSLSADGSIVAIGAFQNAGGGTQRGHVRVYKFNGTNWIQQGADIDGEANNDYSGSSVSLSADGSTLAIGASANAGGGTGRGHVRVYKFNGTNWIQQGADIDGEADYDRSGFSVSLSADGSIVAIGAPYNAGGGTWRGHVRVYKNISGTWTQQGADIDGEADYDRSGFSVSLSADGSIVAIGAPYNAGVGGSSRGHVRVYKNMSGTWTQQGADIDDEADNGGSGSPVSLSADGSIVAIGARLKAGGGYRRGHVRVYKNMSGSWTQHGADIDGEADNDQSGRSVSLSADGSTLAIGASANAGGGTGRGHVRVYKSCPSSFTVTGGGSYCQGGTGVAIGLSGSETGVMYQLKNGASAVGSPISGTGSSIKFGLQTAVGTYTVEATRTIGGCTADMLSSVSVSITYPFTALASSVACSGGSLQLSTTFSPLGAHKWQGPAGFSSNSAKPVVKNMSQAKAGVYTVSVTYNNCISLASVSVSVPAPQTAWASSNSPVCIGSSIRLTANTVGESYQWKGPKSFNSSLKTPSVAATNTTQRGVYSLTVTGSTGCYSTATVSVVVQACGSTRIASEEAEEIDMEINTYPNPTSKLLTVEVRLKEPSSLKLNLYNATGHSLTEWNLSEETTTHRKEIDMSVYKDGLYLIQAQSKDGKQSKRVVKVE